MLIAAGFVLARSSPVAADDWRKEIIIAGQQAVRNTIREELRTSFAGVEETQFEELAGAKYQLGGWVDLITEQGQISRQHFSCIIFHDDNGDWAAKDIVVMPQ